MTVCRRFGTRLWWGIPVKLAPFVDQHFEVKLYGVGFWMCPIIPGVLFWKRRRRRPAGDQP
jgi:hypothetical protein